MRLHPKDIAALIDIRAFLINAVDNLTIKMNREEVKKVQAKVEELGKSIITSSLNMDLSYLDMDNWVDGATKQITVNSTDDVKDLAHILEEAEKVLTHAKEQNKSSK